MQLYIGLMSGTSVDGIDAALVDFAGGQTKLIASHYVPYGNELRASILALCQRGEDEIQRLGELDVQLGKAFAQAVNELLVKQQLSATDIYGIGSHGQTIRHYPHAAHPFTLQIGDPNTIAALTGITTVADFRRKDMAYGGQGAPLVPAFHQAVFGRALDPARDDNPEKCIVNIGGIANVTVLSKKTLGFDTGPGNTLLDAWIGEHQQMRHDENGNWARQGKSNPGLLQQMLADSYFALTAPKSTGREYFNLAWLNAQLKKFGDAISPQDVQATLVELTAQTICDAVRQHVTSGEMLICGGGVQNDYLMERLRDIAGSSFSVYSTAEFGMDPNWIEAVAFAWLAHETLNKRAGNLPNVTGASQATILGGVYFR